MDSILLNNLKKVILSCPKCKDTELCTLIKIALCPELTYPYSHQHQGLPTGKKCLPTIWLVSFLIGTCGAHL